MGNEIGVISEVVVLVFNILNIYAVMIYINNFKKINDTLGHHIGDITLKSAAELIDKVFSEDNYYTYRIDGDEFALVAESISADILENKIEMLKTTGVNSESGVSFSVGYAKADFNHNNAIDNAFIRADKVMYEDKVKLKNA